MGGFFMFNKKTIRALEQFADNVHWTKSLPTEQSMRNLEESLVEILYANKSHKGNGLLITGNGYFLTVDHSERDPDEECPPAKYIRDYKKNIYPIRKICQTDEREDIALLKAEIPGEKIHIEYKIYNTNNLKNFKISEFPVIMKARHNGKINHRPGSLILKHVINKQFNYTNQFGTDVPIISGDSGGIVISSYGELVGFVSNGFEEEEFEIWEKQIVRSYCSKIFTGLNLIKKEINSLRGF
ncbi:Uncharacterised protein [uncultured archaeon]|nr:Uncharacterised protein [uncultured archaeon]